MLFTELNNGKAINLIHISEITVEDNAVVYKSAKGSLSVEKEYFDTHEDANTRFEELKTALLA